MSKVIEIEKIREVFKSMKYDMGNNENKSLLSKQSEDGVHGVLELFENKFDWCNLKNRERKLLLEKLSSEIEKEVDAFIQEEQFSSFVRQQAVPYLIATLRYYSNFCDLVQENHRGSLVVRLPNYTCIQMLGYIFGPALSTGYKVLFICPQQVVNIVKTIELISIKIGFPEDAISYISEQDYIEHSELIMRVATIFYAFSSVENIRVSNKKLLGITSLPTPVVVFDNADLDSACDCVVNSTWNNQPIFTSTAKEVLVQETVYDKFISNLKEKISLSGNINGKVQDDILSSLINEAEKEGIEVFPKRRKDEIHQKTLFLGGRVSIKITPVTPYISIVPFRSIKEAISLANNNTQGLCASVWTENIGLANQMAQNLKVSNVWINCFDVYSPEIPFRPLKLSGKGYFGGVQNLYEFLHNIPSLELPKQIYTQDNEKLFQKTVSSAKKAYIDWSSTPRHLRINKFSSVIQFIETNKNKFKNEISSIAWLNEWKECFYLYIQSHFGFSSTSPIKKYNLNVSYSPRGVLVAEMSHNKKLLIASILEGNSLIIVNTEKQVEGFYRELSQQLPIGVLSILPYSSDIPELALKNPDIDCYFNLYDVGIDFSLCHTIERVSMDLRDIFSRVTSSKNIWCNIGQGI